MDLGNIFSTVDGIRTAKLRQQMAADEMQDAATARQDRLDLRSARSAAWSSGGQDQAAIGKLVALDPKEAAGIQEYFQGLDEKKRAEEAARSKEELEAMGRVMGWVKAQPDPASAYVKARQAFPEKMRAKLPPSYDPDFVDFSLVRLMETDQVIDMALGARGSQAITAALTPQQAAPRGAQGAITPSPNPAGLDERIVSAVDSMPLGQVLTASESGGNFGAQNDAMGSGGQGHFGRGQFSIGRLDDAKRAGIIPPDMTPQQFMGDPDAQVMVERWHRSDIEQFIRDKGLDRFIGQSINGVPLTAQGMVNVAHLGGKGGLERFVTSGGAYNPADTNGTSLSDYAAMGARDEAAQPAAPPQGVAELLSAAAAGGIGDEQRKILLGAAERLSPNPADRYRNVGDGVVDLSAPGGPKRVNLAGDGPAPVNFADESSLRKEWNQVTQDYRTVGDAYSRIAAAVETPSPASDISLIFQYMKMLDPGSVVRESEFGLAANARPLLERYGLSWDKVAAVWRGERLTPDVRADFASRAQDLINTAAANYTQQRDLYRTIAAQSNLDPERAVPNLDIYERLSEDDLARIGAGNPGANQTTEPGAGPAGGGPVQIGTVDDYNALPAGTIYIDPNGNQRTKR